MDHIQEPNDGSIGTSLLIEVRNQCPDAWRRMVEVYGPLVYRWCRQAGISEHAAADVGQEVFRAMANGIDNFRREKPGDTFIGWMRQITKFKIADFQRLTIKQPAARGGSTFLGVISRLEQPENRLCPDSTEKDANEFRNEEREILIARALDVLKSNFQPKTWQAFWATAVEERPNQRRGIGFGNDANGGAKGEIQSPPTTS